MEYDKQMLETEIRLAFNGKDDWCKQPTIRNTKDLFGHIKKMQRAGGVEVELACAKNDLCEIFKMNWSAIKSMTKNHIYLGHQIKMVNAIFDMLRKEDYAIANRNGIKKIEETN